MTPAVRRRVTAAVVDYGAGNLASVARTLDGMGYRCRVTRQAPLLAEADIVVLPGVGAFPAAMQALHGAGLVEPLRERGQSGRPLVGICLGMQLLAQSSTEHRPTPGLGLLPGEVRPLAGARWHIGWNPLEVQPDDALLRAGQGQAVYFNHSYGLPADTPGCAAWARPGPDAGEPAVAAAVRQGAVVGLQFHPEKSQHAGHALLRDVIEGLLA